MLAATSPLGAQRHVIVVGAGVGGLSAAIALAGHGHKVTLLERHRHLGGKMRAVTADGAQVDAGPTDFTMKWVFERLFAAVGQNFDDWVQLSPMDLLARHGWDSGALFDLPADRLDAREAISSFFGADNAEGFVRFSKLAGMLHHSLRDSFMDAPKPGPLAMAARLGPSRLLSLIASQPQRNIWTALGDFFPDQRLRQLFARFSTYCGGSPFETASTLMLIADVEQDGVWTLAGGMSGFAATLGVLAQSAGVTVQTGCGVARFLMNGSGVSGVVTEDDRQLLADAVVFNGDPGALADGLLGAAPLSAGQALRPSQRSLSALTWLAHETTGGLGLLRHNVYFSKDYRREFRQLRRDRRLPDDPTVYICAQDRPADSRVPFASGQRERLQVLVNAPALSDAQDDGPTKQEIEQCRASVVERLERCGVQISLCPSSTQVRGPADFARLFPGSNGAIYGRAPHGPLAPFVRPGAATAISGLYLAGGGVHPSAGVPMASLSGWTAAQAVHADLVSTKRLHRAGISGGISTPSATTVPTG